MVRISDTHIGRSIRRYIRDHIIINFAVIRIQPQIHRNIGIKSLEIRNCFLIDGCLGFVGIIFSPESNFILPGSIKLFRNGKSVHPFLPMTTGKKKQASAGKRNAGKYLFKNFCHPLVPPLDTPAIILLRKIKNSTIKGTEITTTAAIIAGIFSRPNPFSRIS